MLTDFLRVMVNNSFYENFDTTFMRNGKSCQNINFFFIFLWEIEKIVKTLITFFFSIKTFFKWINNHYFKGIC